MISDDTEHTIMAAQAVLSSGGDPESFLLSFSWRLRYWLLFLPSGCGWGDAAFRDPALERTFAA